MNRVIREQFDNNVTKFVDFVNEQTPEYDKLLVPGTIYRTNIDKKGKNARSIGNNLAKRITDALKEPEGWLDTHSHWLDNKFTESANVEPTNHKQGNGKVPEISYVQAGEFSEAVDIYEPGYADQWHPRIKEGSSIYVLRVRGDSMTRPQGKSFPEGMLLHVNPENRSPENGEYVIAKINGHGDVTFKQFKQGETKPYLQPLNTSHPTIYDEFSVLGVVVFAGWEL